MRYRFAAARCRCSGSPSSSLVLVDDGAGAPGSRPTTRTSSTCCTALAPPSARALVRHRSGRARPALTHHLGLAHLGHRRLRHRRPSRCVLGTVIGAFSGLAGGGIDTAIMRVMDVLLSFPAFVMAMALAAALGPTSSTPCWPSPSCASPSMCASPAARRSRCASGPMSRRRRPSAPRGCYIVVRHIIPNAMAPIIVQSTLDIGGAILTASASSFIGLGAQQPTAEWGAMVSERARFPARSVVVPDLSRPCHPGDRDGVQPAGRRPARHLRPEAARQMSACRGQRKPSSTSTTCRWNSRPIAASIQALAGVTHRGARRARSSGWSASPAAANRSPPCRSSACCPRAPCGSAGPDPAARPRRARRERGGTARQCAAGSSR